MSFFVSAGDAPLLMHLNILLKYCREGLFLSAGKRPVPPHCKWAVSFSLDKETIGQLQLCLRRETKK